MASHKIARQGFTLIELSIVLVIIGLIIGGVLVGQSLVSTAAVRAQLAQIEKYNTAVTTFRVKYNALPGDLTSAYATQFGFTARSGVEGRGDGNGLLEGYNYQCPCVQFFGPAQPLPMFGGETAFFWEDLSYANFIPGIYNANIDSEPPNMTGTLLNSYLPPASIGNGNYIHIYSNNGSNYFTIIALIGGAAGGVRSSGDVDSQMGLTVVQAYNMDKKVDDGLPTTGKIQAIYPSLQPLGYTTLQPATSAPMPSVSTCYDTTSNQYSMTQIGGAGLNCALSFQMQGAAR